jgi:hypothetical protein
VIAFDPVTIAQPEQVREQVQQRVEQRQREQSQGGEEATHLKAQESEQTENPTIMMEEE